MSSRLLRLGVVSVLLAGALGAGTFSAMSSRAGQVAQDSVVRTVPASWTPNVRNGQVDAIVQVGDEIVVGGTFTQVSPHGRDDDVSTRTYVLAFDATDGTLSQAFAPNLDGAVDALAPGPDGHSVYVGGRFKNVNGVASKSLALLDLDTGKAVSGFNVPKLYARVTDLAVSGGRLYVAGYFTWVGGEHHMLAAVDAKTGEVDPFVDTQFTGTHNGGATNIKSIAISPDGSRLVAIGNFSQVDGQDRDQIAMLDLSGSQAKLVSDWRTTGYTELCNADAFDTYMRDVDFSPDGSYFVVVTTGGYGPGEQPTDALCDAAARWETDASGTDVRPTWVDHTGGDTFLSVAVTGTVVYVGGHERWTNNSYSQDSAGPGAVARPGIAALDPANGLPLSWNPRRDPRGVGAWALLATPQGLWVGSDTKYIGYHQYRRERIAFFPLAGGKAVPSNVTGQLPGKVYLLDTPAAGDDAAYRAYDGKTAGDAQPMSDTGVAWSQVRGAVMIDDTLWYGSSGGNFYKRSFDGTSFGQATAPDPYSDPYYDGRKPTFYNEIPQVSGMFFANGRLYYTRGGLHSDLYYRYFTPESGVIGSEEFTASGGMNWSDAGGMFLSGGKLYYATRSDGKLHRVDFADGQPVAGTSTVVSGPGVDGQDWRARSMFLFAGKSSNQDPQASFTESCQSLTCAFDGSGSTDPDGSVASYAWNFGDGATGTAAKPTHAYDDAGTYTVKLTVTDDAGATNTASKSVTVASQASAIAFNAVASADGNVRSQRVTVPASVSAGDGLLLFLSYGDARTVTPSDPSGLTGWSAVETVDAGSLVTKVWRKVAAAGDAGKAVAVDFDGYAKAALQLMAYTGTDSSNPVAASAQASDASSSAAHVTPQVDVASAASWVVSYWADKSSTTTQWTPPDGQAVRDAAYGSTGMRITALATDSGAPAPEGSYGGLTATVNAPSSKAAMVTVVLAPRS